MRDTTIDIGINISFQVTVGGESNVYKWHKNEVVLEGETDSTLVVNQAELDDSGTYRCEIFNTVATELVLYHRPFHLSVVDPTHIVDEPDGIPTRYALRQNYPNPFNPVTMINYQLPIANYVNLTVYNLLGQKVETLVSEVQDAGQHQITWDASGFTSGIYYYRIKSSDFMDIKKMILLR